MRVSVSSWALPVLLFASSPAALGAQDNRRDDVPALREDALPLLGVEVLLPHLARARPFARVFGVALLAARDDPGLLRILQELRPVASRGAPTLRMLSSDISAAADRAISIEAGLERGGVIGRWAASTMRLGASFSGAPTPVLAATTKAIARLASEDLAGAVAAIAAVEGAPGAAFEAWLRAARDRIVVDGVALRLTDLVTRRVGDRP